MKKNRTATKTMQGRKWQRTPISKARNLRELAAFWDEHDISEFPGEFPDVTDQFHINIRSVEQCVVIEPKTLERASRVARRRGLSTEKLINQWVREAVSRA